MSESSISPETSRRPPAAPLFAATVAFSGGILLQSYCYKPASLYFICTMAFALCSLLALRFARSGRREVLAYGGAVLAFLPAGALFTAAHQSRPSPVATVLNFASGEEVTLTGYVARPGSLRKGRDVHESLDMAVEKAQFDGDPPRAVTGIVRLSLYVPGARSKLSWETGEDGADESVAGGGGYAATDAAPAADAKAPPVFDYGQRLRLRAKLRPPVNFRNPGNMDYVGWLRGQGVAALGSAKSTSIDILPGVEGSRMERVRCRVRRSVLERIERLWPVRLCRLVPGDGAGRARTGRARRAAGFSAQRDISPAGRQRDERGDLCGVSAVADAPAAPARGVCDGRGDCADLQLRLAHRFGRAHSALGADDCGLSDCGAAQSRSRTAEHSFPGGADAAGMRSAGAVRPELSAYVYCRAYDCRARRATAAADDHAGS